MSPLITSGFNEGDDEKVVAILKKWDGGVLSDSLFTMFARIMPQPCVEVTILRSMGGLVQTLLIKRPDNDIVWPGMLHTPGTVLRTADFLREDKNPLNGAFERVEGELHTSFSKPPLFVSVIHRMTERGSEVVQVYTAQIDTAPEHSVWADIDLLADRKDFIQHQLQHILIAKKCFLESS